MILVFYGMRSAEASACGTPEMKREKLSGDLLSRPQRGQYHRAFRRLLEADGGEALEFLGAGIDLYADGFQSGDSEYRFSIVGSEDQG